MDWQANIGLDRFYSSMNVRILATCRKKELIDYTLFVFKSIRIGFPTSEIQVTGNALPDFALAAVEEACSESGCKFENGPETIHHRWIEDLIEAEQEPFYVVDTDIVFYESFERFNFDGAALAGYRIPEFQDEFTGAITRSRLHTSLLYIDPALVLEQLEKYEAQFPVTPFNPLANPCYPLCLPFNGKGYFYDTCSMLYHATGGTSFTAEHKQAYFHFNFGTLSDIVLPRLKNGQEIKAVRDMVLNNLEYGRGLWREQEQFYEARQFLNDGTDVIASIKPEDARDARAWNVELCCGNQKAMSFCDQWYGYIHGIDDLVDTLQDGRPLMSKRQIISLFFRAALIYNCPFYMENQALLFPIILDITNAYITSVEWEDSPKQHLRAMADVFRTSGNRMYSMVALICGGDEHMQNISQRIHERDWLGQHDEHGQPI